MAVIRVESGNDHEKALPIAYCVGVIDPPSVRDAVNTAIKNLATDYQS